MEHLLNVLSGELGRIVVDRTGFTEKFNLRLEYEPIRPIMGMPRTAPGDAPVTHAESAPALFDAVKEQLGLELVQSPQPVEVIVIDHVERPSDN